jgi:hypothetical protein
MLTKGAGRRSVIPTKATTIYQKNKDMKSLPPPLDTAKVQHKFTPSSKNPHMLAKSKTIQKAATLQQEKQALRKRMFMHKPTMAMAPPSIRKANAQSKCKPLLNRLQDGDK